MHSVKMRNELIRQSLLTKKLKRLILITKSGVVEIKS